MRFTGWSSVVCSADLTQPGFRRAMKHSLWLQDMDSRMRNVLTDESITSRAAPTRVIWTDHDPTGPFATGERCVAAIPRAEPLVVMEDCAHWPQWEKADAFNALHIEFLLRHAAQSASAAA